MHVLVVNIFHIFETELFRFVVAMSNLVHNNVETMHAYFNKLQFLRKHSYFRQDFQLLLAVKEGEI